MQASAEPNLHENWRRLGIVRTNKFVGLCARLAQTFVFSRTFPKKVDYRQVALECPTPPAYTLCSLRQIFFYVRKTNFPNPVIVFTICAEKVCYKVCNMYYKVCNMRYKVSNMCYKLCNKNFLIGQEKLSCG